MSLSLSLAFKKKLTTRHKPNKLKKKQQKRINTEHSTTDHNIDVSIPQSDGTAYKQFHNQ